MIERSIIISAGGIGKRMGGEVPKQFMLLCNRPILFYTIEKFYQFDPEIEIIVVLPTLQIEFWKACCETHNFKIQHTVIGGGVERFFSVKNGLSLANGKIIGVHDAVRPLVSIDVIAKCYEMALLNEAAIPVFDVNESIRKVDVDGSVAVDRTAYKLVQTPQCFQRDILKDAYAVEFSSQFTDDASVVEYNGNFIHLVKGNAENIKITRPIDLKLAEILLKNE